MASFFLAPDPVQSTFFIPGGAVPGNGVQLCTFVAGSVSTPTTVYKDNAGNAAWSNPIVLDSGGNLPLGGVVWIPAGVTIKAVWAPANDTFPPTSPYRTIDNIAGINDTTASATDWIPGPAPTFISSTQFTLVGDQTAVFTKSRRLKFTVTAGTVYGTITSSSFGAVTTVNVAFTSGALDSGLSSVFYSLIDPSLPSINADYSDKQASTVVSAGNGTTNIWGIAGNTALVSGTNAIFSFSSAPYQGARRKVIFSGVLGLMSSAALTMQGNLNVTTAVNDIADVYAQTSSTNIITFYKANARPLLVAAGDFAAQASSSVLAGPSSGANAIPTFRPLVAGDVPGVGMVFVTSAVVTSAVAAVDFSLGSTYDTYVVDIVAAQPATNLAGLVMRMSNDGGSTFKAGGSEYNYAVRALSEAGGDDNATSTGNSFIQIVGLNGTAVSSAAFTGGVNSRVMIFNPNVSTERKLISVYGSHISGNFVSFSGGGGSHSGSGLTTTAVTNIRFMEAAGNISSGAFYMYGMKKS